MSTLRYTTIRFVPDPIRDESINLGLMMSATDGTWFRVAFLRSYAKVHALGGKGAVSYAQALVRDLEAEAPMDGRQARMFIDPTTGLERYLQERHGDAAGMVRVSAPLSAVTDDPERLFENLYKALIGKYRRPPVSKAARPSTREQLRKVFRSTAIDVWELPPSRLMEGGVVGTVRHPVDFGLYNGRLQSVVHTVSFAGDEDWAVLQRGVLSEAALDIRTAIDDQVGFALLYSPAPQRRSPAAELERSSVAFAERHKIQAVAIGEVGELAGMVASARDH